MIGVFDSGSGGLSVLKALRERIPAADIVYFGDIKHAPYGVRSVDELRELTKAGVAVLRAHGATELISACNSVSANFLEGVAGDMPVIEMTRPTSAGMQAYAGRRVLLIATPATVASGIYERALSSITLDVLAIPELAGAIEFGSSDEDIARIVRDAFEQRAGGRYDALLFGCTHYPLARAVIEAETIRIFGDLICIDPAAFVAQQAAETFADGGKGVTRFLISKDSPHFRANVAAILATAPYSIEVI